jgi:hypothetical protein
VTTLLESGISRKHITSVCAAFADPTIDHGLNTGSLFSKDLVMDPANEDPSYILVHDVTDAFEPDSTLIQRF